MVVAAVFAEAEAGALLTGVRPLVTSALTTWLLATGTLATAERTLGDDAMPTLRVPLSATANVLLLMCGRTWNGGGNGSGMGTGNGTLAGSWMKGHLGLVHSG